MQKRQERDNVLVCVVCVCVCPDIAAFDGFCILIWSEAFWNGLLAANMTVTRVSMCASVHVWVSCLSAIRKQR